MSDEHEVRDVYFILDGGPMGKCSQSDCFSPSAGTYLILDYDTDEQLGTTQLCEDHAKEMEQHYDR